MAQPWPGRLELLHSVEHRALREGIDTLPVAFLDARAHEIRVLPLGANYRNS